MPCMVSRALLVGETFIGGHVGSPGGQGFPCDLTSLKFRPPRRISNATLSRTTPSNRGQAAGVLETRRGPLERCCIFRMKKASPRVCGTLKYVWGHGNDQNIPEGTWERRA